MKSTDAVGGNRDGFSLVEVMISMTLLGVAMMSLAGAAALGLSRKWARRARISSTRPTYSR